MKINYMVITYDKKETGQEILILTHWKTPLLIVICISGYIKSKRLHFVRPSGSGRTGHTVSNG